MKKLVNTLIFASLITFLAATALKADLYIAQVVNETSEDVFLLYDYYGLKIPACQTRKLLGVSLSDNSNFASIGTRDRRVYFWLSGADLVVNDLHYCTTVLENINSSYSAGLLVRVTEQGVFFRLLADFEKTVVGTICA